MNEREPAIFAPRWWKSPAGIILPSTLQGQVNSGLPDDLPPELRPKLQPVAFHEPADANSQLRTFVDEQVVGLPTSTLAELEEMVGKLSFEPAIEALSIVAARTVAIGDSAQEQIALAEAVFHGAPILEKIEGAIKADPSMHLFGEQNLTALMQLMIDAAKPRSFADGAATSELGIFNRALFGATAISELEGEDFVAEFEDEERWLPYLIQLASFYANPGVMTELTRIRLMLDIARSPAAKAFDSYCPLDEWYSDELGLTAAEQLRLMMGCAVICNAFDGTKTKTHMTVEAVENMLVTVDLVDKKEQALSLISATREEFREAFADLGEGPRRLLWELRPFKNRPFLRCENDDFILLSPRFLESWFAEGFHYRALDIARNQGEAGKYLAFAGRLYETYCVELTAESHQAIPSIEVHGDLSYVKGKPGKTCDVTVDFVTDLVLVEITNSRFKAKTLTEGNRADALADLDRVLVKKCKQLDTCINRVLAKEAPFPKDPGVLERIWPIVVSAGVPMQTPPLWDYLHEKLPGAFKQPGVQPLTILDPEEYEVLLGLAEAGNPLPDLLTGKTVPAYRHVDLAIWLRDDPQAPRAEQRASMIERAFRRNAEEIAAGMKFKRNKATEPISEHDK